MPKSKEQYQQIRAKKMELIKNSALILFAEKGYDATSISDIAITAQISKGLLYHYFKNKEELLTAIWDGLMLEFADMIDPNHDGKVTDEEATNFIDKLFEHLKNKRHIYKLYFQITFQPKVLDFLLNNYDANRARQQQGLIFEYFSKKFPFNDAKINYFTALVFFKGLGLVVPYTEEAFDNDFLDKYKEALKKIF
jgi:AcrR family transcriptional regulator